MGAMSARTVTVTGLGTASAPPDLVRADLEVWSEAASAGEALTDANEQAHRLLRAIAELGVSADDLATTSVQLGPSWDREGRPSGFRASNAVQLTLRDLDAAGAQLDALARLLGDHAQLGGIVLGLADDRLLHTTARAAAVRDAQARAEELAAAVGRSLGKVRRIVEGGQGLVPRAMAKGVAADAGIPLAGGATTVSVAVEVEFALE